jgi:hypothetical protein
MGTDDARLARSRSSRGWLGLLGEPRLFDLEPEAVALLQAANAAPQIGGSVVYRVGVIVSSDQVRLDYLENGHNTLVA